MSIETDAALAKAEQAGLKLAIKADSQPLWRF